MKLEVGMVVRDPLDDKIYGVAFVSFTGATVYPLAEKKRSFETKDGELVEFTSRRGKSILIASKVPWELVEIRGFTPPDPVGKKRRRKDSLQKALARLEAKNGGKSLHKRRRRGRK